MKRSLLFKLFVAAVTALFVVVVGIGYLRYFHVPSREYARPRIIQIAHASDSSAALFSDGTVRRWGNVSCAKDAIHPCERTIEQEAAEVVKGLQNIVQIGIGEKLLCALVFDGTVVCADGYRFTCEDCEGERVYLDNWPTRISGLEDIAEIGVMGRSACARSVGGNVYCWGDLSPPGANHDIASSVMMGAAKMIAVSAFDACAILIDGAAMCWGYLSDIVEATVDDRAPFNPPVRVDGVNDAVSISANDGSYHGPFHAVLSDGTVRWWSIGNVLRKTCLAFLNDGAAARLDNYDPHANECFDSDIYLAGDRPLSEFVIGLQDVVSIENSVDGEACAVLKNGRVSCWKWEAKYDPASGRWQNKLVDPWPVPNLEQVKRFYNYNGTAEVINAAGAALFFDQENDSWEPLPLPDLR